MSKNWGVAAGIGQGVMQGLGFLRQMDADKRSQQMLENQSEVLGMQKDIHREKMGEITRQNEDRVRTENLSTLKTGIESNYQDRTEAERAEMFRKYGAETGLFKPADLEAATKVRDGMVKMAGPDAYRALISGNITPMQKMLATKGYNLQADAKSGKYMLTVPGGGAPQVIDKEGLVQLDEMATYRDQENAKAKLDLERRKTLAEIDNKNADTRLKDRLPQDRIGGAGGAGGGRGAGGKEPKPFGLDINDIEKFAPLDPTTGKPDPQKVISIASNAESIFNLNPAIREKSPYAAYQIAAGIEKGDIKPELLRDPATNSYYKAVKYGSGTVRIGGEMEADPDAFYANNPAAIKVRISNDRAWLDQYTKSIPDPKQRETIGLALRGDTPQGAAARNEIIAAYNKVKGSGNPIPSDLAQMYSALQTADRLKSAPPVEQKPAPKAESAAPVDTSIKGKPSYDGFLEASEKLDKVRADAEKMSPDRREQYLANRVPELEALMKHHSNYLKYR